MHKAGRLHRIYLAPDRHERADAVGPFCAKCGGKRVTKVDLTHDGSKTFEVKVKCHGEETAWSYEYPMGRSQAEREACLLKVNHMLFFESSRENASQYSNWVKGTG